jgi:integrase/recombinase XerC
MKVEQRTMTNEPFSQANTTLAPRSFSLDQIIAIWLHEKANRTHSAETERAYGARLNEFRALLHAAGLDLNSDPQLVAVAAQGWADHTDRVDERGRPIAVAPTTYNQRLAILSSFYQTAIKRGVLTANPITTIDRRPVEDYASAVSLDQREVRVQLDQIDRTTLAGKRDYALIGVLLNTGRRRAEVNGMRWGALHISGQEVTIDFPRTKGGKRMRNTLPVGVGKTLLDWLHAFYGARIGELSPDAPIWVSLAHNGTYGKAVSARAFSLICDARLGVSKVHSLRHTFTDAMEEAGAKLSEIRDQLGHASIATTDRYIQKRRRAKNRHGDTIAHMFGFDEEE